MRKLAAIAAASALFILPGCSSVAAAPASSAATRPAHANEVSEAPRPNVLFILFDDLGYGQLGFTGHRIIQTPNIDRLAHQGMIFSNGYAGSTVCSPSRISLMTGRDTSRMSSAGNDIELLPSDRTIAHVLGEAGYSTALFGKFGIGTQFGETDPMAMGFGHWVGLMHNIEAHRQYPTFVYRDNQVTFVPGNIAGAKGTFAQRLFTRRGTGLPRPPGWIASLLRLHELHRAAFRARRARRLRGALSR